MLPVEHYLEGLEVHLLRLRLSHLSLQGDQVGQVDL